jgi:hypothetical protein
MTLRGFALAAALLAATTTEAAACHHYAVWHYPWRQSCGWASEHRKASAATTASSDARKVPSRFSTPEPALPLPSLARADLDGGEADEPTRAHVLLRAVLEAANAH